MIDADILRRKLRSLQWTEEIRPDHPWFSRILVSKTDVEKIIDELDNSSG